MVGMYTRPSVAMIVHLGILELFFRFQLGITPKTNEYSVKSGATS